MQQSVFDFDLNASNETNDNTPDGWRNKLRYDLLPPDAIQEIVRGLSLGARKHGDRAWEKGRPWVKSELAAIRRHLASWEMRQDIDESGENNLTLAVVRGVLLLAMVLRDVGKDDRLDCFKD